MVPGRRGIVLSSDTLSKQDKSCDTGLESVHLELDFNGFEGTDWGRSDLLILKIFITEPRLGHSRDHAVECSLLRRLELKDQLT
jgi:hypothetical protein